MQRALLAENNQPQNGVIVHSELLLDYLRKTYPGLYLVSSTTKVLTDFGDFERELSREDFRYVVPDFRLNKAFGKLGALSDGQKSSPRGRGISRLFSSSAFVLIFP